MLLIVNSLITIWWNFQTRSHTYICENNVFRSFKAASCFLYSYMYMFSLNNLCCCCCLFSSGHHQQHHHPQHDVHKDLAEIWPVGRQQGQHRLRPRLLIRESPEQSETKNQTKPNKKNNMDTSMFEYILYTLYSITQLKVRSATCLSFILWAAMFLWRHLLNSDLMSPSWVTE